MTPTEVAAILRQLNAWRRCDKNIRLPDPRDIGEAIDAAIEMIDRLEAAERERDDVAQQLVQSEQGKRKISEERDALRNEIACVKEVEFPRKAQAVADAWKGKCKRLEAERDALRVKVEAAEKSDAESLAMYRRARDDRDALRAKIEAMERQEPVGVLHVGSCYGEELEDWLLEAHQDVCDKLNEAHAHSPTSLPLYALPGAKGGAK